MLPDPLYIPPKNKPHLDEKWLVERSMPQSIQFMIDILPTIRRLLKKWPKYKIMKVLDVGTATGAGANLLATLHRSQTPVKMEVDCLDLTDKYKKYADANFKDINYMVGDIFSLEKNRKWDLIICSHLIEHFKDPTTFILELKRRSRFYAIFYTPFEEQNLSGSHEISFNFENISKFNPESVEIIESPSWNHPIDNESKCVIFTLRGIESLPLVPNIDECLEIKKIKSDLDRHKDYRKVVDMINPLLKKYPEDAQLNYLAGVCYHNKNKFEKALKYYNSAIENGFNEFWVWYNRGNLYKSIGEFDKAFEDLKQAVELKPSHNGAQNSLNFVKNRL